MKKSDENEAWQVEVLDSRDADLLQIIPAAAIDKISRRAFASSTNWDNQQTRVVFEADHPLYKHLFEIYAVGIYKGLTNSHLSSLAQHLTKQCDAIIQLLSDDTKIPLNELAEQQRWGFLTTALSHCHQQMLTRRIGDVAAIKLKTIRICQLLDLKLTTRDYILRNDLRKINQDLDGTAILFAKQNLALSAIKSLKKDFKVTLEWNHREKVVSISYDHVLYFDIFEIFALSKYTGDHRNEAMTLAENVIAYLNRIIAYLKTNPKLNMNNKEEELRWSFLLKCVSHVTLSCQYFNLCDIQSLFNSLSELCLLIKPHIGTSHRIASRYLKILKIDIACFMAEDRLQKDDLSSAEDYLYLALYGSQKYLVTNQENRFATLFMIYNCLADIHLRRSDYLAAEVQYDNAVRFICSDVNLYHQQKEVWILYNELANHYRSKGQWKDEKRLRQKTIELCDLFLGHAEVAKKIPRIKEQTETLRKTNQIHLINGTFYNEIPNPIPDLINIVDAKRLTLSFKTKDSYDKMLSLLTSLGVVIPKLCSEEALRIQLKTLPANFDLRSFYLNATKLLCPQQEKSKPVKTITEPIVTEVEALPDKPAEEKDLFPAEKIIFTPPKDTKRVTSRNQRGNKSKRLVDNPPSSVSFFVSQRRTIPACVRWQDERFGELVFKNVEQNPSIIIMRNEHNCGKPVFGLLCTDLIQNELLKHYHPQEVDSIMAVMTTTFTEAKQARFFGRGIKSCPNDPKVKGTEFRLVLKPSTGFNNQFRVYGRCINNGEHTLFIFHAIDVAPKKAASKLTILEPVKQIKQERRSSIELN